MTAIETSLTRRGEPLSRSIVWNDVSGTTRPGVLSPWGVV